MLAKNLVIPIQSSFDLIYARNKVREMARVSGFTIRDQAAISLAVSSIAQEVSLGMKYEGEISIFAPECIDLPNQHLIKLQVLLMLNQVEPAYWSLYTGKDWRLYENYLTIDEPAPGQIRLTASRKELDASVSRSSTNP